MKLVSGQGEWEDQQAQRLPGRPPCPPESQGGSSWVASVAGVPLPECTCGVPCWCWFGDGGDVRLPSIRLLPCVLTRKNSKSTGAGPRSGQQRVVGAAHRAPSQAGMLRSTFSLTVEGRGGQRAAKIPHKEVLPLEKDKAWSRPTSPTQNLGNHRVPGQNGPFFEGAGLSPRPRWKALVLQKVGQCLGPFGPRSKVPVCVAARVVTGTSTESFAK